VIHNQRKPYPTVLYMMEQSKYTYYLTGSRYFGTAKDGSDWDYFVENCDEVRKELIDFGFKSDVVSYPDSKYVQAVFKYEDENNVMYQIQCVIKAAEKERVQFLMAPFMRTFGKNLEKAAQKKLWDLALNLVEYGKS
jgi:hypothetical protein